MAANNEPVSFKSLATVKKYGDPNIELREALVLASELKRVTDRISIEWNGTYVTLLHFSEEAIRHGLRSPGTAEEKIQAVVDYQRNNPSLAMRNNREFNYNPSATSPNTIVKELKAALEGNTDFIKAAESSDDCDISSLSPDVVLLAAQTFMYRNGHDGVSDEDALQAFHKAIQYQNGELRTSTEFLKCKERKITEIIKCVNLYFIEESIDIIGLNLVKYIKTIINPYTELPKSEPGPSFKWEVFPLSEVDERADRDDPFENRSEDDIIPQWDYGQGQNFYRSYIFCSRDEAGRKRNYVMQFRRTVTVGGVFTNIENMISRNNINPEALLNEFQIGKEDKLVDSDFQKCGEYLWSKDGKPPALPYFIVAQLYWAHYIQDLNFLQEQKKHQVTDKEALQVIFAEVPILKKKGKEDEEKTDPTFKTYTWFLNKPSNAVNDCPELKDYSEGQNFTGDYLHPSTQPLQTEGFHYEWSRDNHESTHQDFTLLYRARPTLESVPQTILEENRIRFDYWQYIKEFVFFGGSSTEGTVLAPDPAWIDEAHRNGVAIFGTVFLPPLDYGGNEQDIVELSKSENLEKLVDIARRLNFEGWFLNVESYRSCNDPSLEMLKSSLQNLNLGGKTFIWYLPSTYQSNRLRPENSDVRMTCDGNISNLSGAFLDEPGKNLYLNFYHLIRDVFGNKSPLTYLMFVDEPFWQITLKGKRAYLVNAAIYPYAQNCHWQFFLGENGLEREPTDTYRWYGIAKYAKQRKQ